MQKNYDLMLVSIFSLACAVLAVAVLTGGDKQINIPLSGLLTGTALTIMATGFILSPNSAFSTKVAGWFILGIILCSYLVRFWI